MNCKVCSDSKARIKHQYPGSPYWICLQCGLMYQDPMPPKKYEASEEKGPDGRSAGANISAKDKAVIENFARAWYQNYLSKIPANHFSGTTIRTLDIGSKYPYFAHILKKELKCEAYGIDALDLDDPSKDSIVMEYAKELDVEMLLVDFEKISPDQIIEKTTGGKEFEGVSMIHVFEHIYDPKQALWDVSMLLRSGGSFLIRVPSSDVMGYEKHLSSRHYPIHPFFYSEKSFKNLLHVSGAPFDLVETYGMGQGNRDFVLKRL